MITTLLSIIALVEIIRLVMVYKKPSKKGYFKKRLAETKKLEWDMEFKVFKTREVREDVRKEYARAKARLHGLEEQIKNWPENKDKGEKARLEDQVVLTNRDIERYEAQMAQMDLEIEGSKPTNEYPNGLEGISHQLDSLKEVQSMLKDWIKQC